MHQKGLRLTPTLLSRHPLATCGLVLALMLPLSSAHGQEESDTGTVEAGTKVRQCLDAVGKAGSDPRACVGVMADACLEQPQNSEPDASEACIVGETGIWQELLQSRFEEARKALPDESATRLEEVQASWATYRDQLCEIGTVIYSDQALVAVWRANCLLEETGRRAIELGAFVGEIRAR